MPSVFDDVADIAERRSLNANGYAAIKELNAFTLMRDRQIDPWRYPFLKIELPDGHGQLKKYIYSPYDLCFLFEKQNQDDKHLNGFEAMKKNIADCVWMQTINPVLEENGSLEDNLFKIVSTSNRDKRYERFAGMGIAQLIYPYRALEPYFAIVLADAVVQQDWYAADLAWEKAMESRSAEEDGFLNSYDEESYYCDFAEDRAEWSDRINKVKKDDWVGVYLSKVDELVSKCMEENPGKEISNCREDLVLFTKNGDNHEAWSDEWIRKFEDYYDKMLRDQTSVRIKNRDYLFRRIHPELPKRIAEQKWEMHQVEYWLFGDINSPQTPIENRYFLATLDKKLEERCSSLEQEITEAKNKNAEYLRAITRIKDMNNPRSRWSRHVLRRHQETMIEGVNAIEKQYRDALQLEVYKEIGYMVKNLWRVYRILLRDYTRWVNQEQAYIRKNLLDDFESHDGRTSRLVCASETCLNQMEAIVRGSAKGSELASSFAHALCKEVIRQQKRGLDADGESLKDFWKDGYTKVAGHKLDVDVLTALENEACWEYEKKHGKPLERTDKMYNATVKHYMEEQAFRMVRDIFVRAFLRIPNAQQRHTLQMCIYPSDIPRENVLLNEIVVENLDKNHGCENKDSGSDGKYRIDFYRAVFGVSAGEISTFLHKENNSPISSGDGYNDYTVMVSMLDWQNQKKNFLTPHIDWRWHESAAMPELSEGHTRVRYGKILKAALWGLMIGKILHTEGGYKIEMIGRQAFDHSMVLNHTFSDLVRCIDESPRIMTLLESTECDSKQWVGSPENRFADVIGLAIKECARGLARNFSQDEQIGIMEEVFIDLAYLVETTDSFQGMQEAVQSIKSRLDRLLSGGGDTEIRETMKRHLTAARIEDRLMAWNVADNQ